MTRLLYISVCLRTRQDTISYSSDIYSSETGTSIDGYGEKTKDEYDKDEYDEKTSMAKDEYALVREHLGVVAQRMTSMAKEDEYGKDEYGKGRRV